MVDHVRPKTLLAPTAAALRRNCARTGFPMPGYAWPFWSPNADGLVPDIVGGVDATQVTPVEGSWVTTRLGAALDVANTTSRSVDLPGTNAVQLAGAFTFTAYVTIDTASVSELLCGSDTSSVNYLFFATSTLFYLRAGGGASSVAHGGITPGAIMRLDATRDGDDLVTVYMDGHALGSFTMSGTFDIGRFGDRASANIPWYGKLIDIRICDGECASAAAIARDMALGMSVYQLPANLIAMLSGALGGGGTTVDVSAVIRSGTAIGAAIAADVAGASVVEGGTTLVAATWSAAEMAALLTGGTILSAAAAADVAGAVVLHGDSAILAAAAATGAAQSIVHGSTVLQPEIAAQAASLAVVRSGSTVTATLAADVRAAVVLRGGTVLSAALIDANEEAIAPTSLGLVTGEIAYTAADAVAFRVREAGGLLLDEA